MPPHRHGSHYGDTHIIRHAYSEGEKYVPRVLHAQALWNALIQKTAEALFQPCGVLEPDAGLLRSERAVTCLIKLTNEAGCHQLFNCPVSAVAPIDGGIEVTTGKIVSEAAKPWLQPELGLKPCCRVRAEKILQQLYQRRS